MPERPVKPPSRRYDSPRRRAQAEATRAAILDAAGRRFARDGWAGTTMAAVALEAGVALKTVYLAFSTKSGLLRALWNARLRGDADDVPMPERPWYRELLAEADGERAVVAISRVSRAVKDRAGPVMIAIREGAAADPEVAALWERIEREFHALLVPVADALAARGALRPGLAPAAAADVLWTLNHPDVWRLLVAGRGWSGDEYEAWLVRASRAELLGS